MSKAYSVGFPLLWVGSSMEFMIIESYSIFIAYELPKEFISAGASFSES